MKICDITKNLKENILSRWPEDEFPVRLTFINEQLHSLEQIKQEIKRVKKDKQAIARSFKEVSQIGTEIDALKRRMKTVSDNLKVLESSRRAIEADLIKLFSDELKPDTPERFSLNRNQSTNGKPIQIGLLGDDEYTLWDEYVIKHKQSSVYHLSAWQELINSCFGHRAVMLTAKNNQNQLCGVLSITILESALFGNFAVAIPYFNYGGPLADCKGIEQQLVFAASELCHEKNLSHLELRSTHPINDWPTQEDKVSMLLALTGSQNQLDKQLGAKIRAQIKLGRSHQFETIFGGKELLPQFYKVFATNMRDLGTPVYDKAFFAKILETFPNNAIIVVLKHNGRPVSAAFLIGYKDVLEIPWASTLRSANSMNANMLLYREVIGYAIDQGYHYFDFGRSSKNSPTYRFKKQWGAKPVQHYWHYWLAEGEKLPELNPNNPKYRLAIAAWKKMPVWLTKLIGPHIVKNLP